MVVTKHHLTANADYKVDKPFTIVYDTIAHNKTIDKDNEAQVAAFEKLDIFIQDALKQYLTGEHNDKRSISRIFKFDFYIE